jgi:hypothetical protein
MTIARFYRACYDVLDVLLVALFLRSTHFTSSSLSSLATGQGRPPTMDGPGVSDGQEPAQAVPTGLGPWPWTWRDQGHGHELICDLPSLPALGRTRGGGRR